MTLEAGRRRIVVGISGASGAILGIRLLELARQLEVETHLVVSPAAEVTLQQETDYSLAAVCALASVVYPSDEIGAVIASGSFRCQGMAIIPCSVKTLSAVANSYAADLMVRAADVTLKEGRRLVLVVRETPLHLGHLRLMCQAAEAGAIIFPPAPAFYPRPQSIDEMVTFSAGRVLERLGIENNLYPAWPATRPEDRPLNRPES